MADKELLVFVLDATVPSSSYAYLFQVLAAKLLKGLKTDYVSVALFHSANTVHAVADSGKFRGIEVLLDFETVCFENLQRLEARLSAEKGHPDPESSDAVQATLFSSMLFRPTVKKVFTRNVVLITSCESPIHADSHEKIERLLSTFAEIPSNLYVILDEPNDLFGSLVAQFKSGSLFSTEDASSLTLNHPPIRKTRPVATYKGLLRLGADISLDTDNPGVFLYQDTKSSQFGVELYPAVKLETSSLHTHEYIIDNGAIVKLEKTRSHFVWEKNFQGDRNDNEVERAAEEESDTEKKFDKKVVEATDLTPGFKFSNFDLIALDSDLKAAAKLETNKAFDILGFIHSALVPTALFTDEALYVVPEKSSTRQNDLNFRAFAQALYGKELAAICRLVRKSGSEVEVGACFPIKVAKDSKQMHAFIFIRLPFKEDEKIGVFPQLHSSEKADNEASVNALMEDFINSKTLTGEPIQSKTIIDNAKATMMTSDGSKLPLPPKLVSSDRFLCSSPSATRFSRYMLRILLNSLSAQDWVAFFTDKQFVQENIRTDADFTNFFNLQNCLAVNSGLESQGWLAELSEKLHEPAKRLADELDVKFVKREEKKKRVAEGAAHQKGNYGADEGDYGEIPDFAF